MGERIEEEEKMRKCWSKVELEGSEAMPLESEQLCVGNKGEEQETETNVSEKAGEKVIETSQ